MVSTGILLVYRARGNLDLDLSSIEILSMIYFFDMAKFYVGCFSWCILPIQGYTRTGIKCVMVHSTAVAELNICIVCSIYARACVYVLGGCLCMCM